MANGIENAGGLDGVTGWTATAGAARLVEDTALGGPGRAAIVAAKALTIGQSISLWSTVMPVTAGDSLVAMALCGNSEGGVPSLQVEIVDGVAARLALLDVPMTRRPVGLPRRGLRAAYGEYVALLQMPVTGFARLLATSFATAAATHKLALLKPFLGPAEGRLAPSWDPGAHINPDIQLSAWPAALARFRRDLQVEPYADREAFSGDARIPANSKVSAGGHAALRGRMSLDPEQADVLDQFYASGASPFFIVRPDTDQLCLAEWLADGMPKPAGFNGIKVLWDVGLHIWIA